MPAVAFTPTQAELHALAAVTRSQLLDAPPLGRAMKVLFAAGSICGLVGTSQILLARLPPAVPYLNELRVSALAVSAGFFMLFIWAYARQALVRKLTVSLYAEQVVPVEMQLADGKLVAVSPGQTTAYDRAAIQRIEVADGLLLFYTSADNALFVPGRAFDDAASFERFVQSARDWHGADAA